MKIYMFRTVPLSIIRSFSLYTQQKTPDDGQRNCPKHVDFHSKVNFLELVHLVGLIRYEGNSISKLQIQVATYVFELSAGNCHR